MLAQSGARGQVSGQLESIKMPHRESLQICCEPVSLRAFCNIHLGFWNLIGQISMQLNAASKLICKETITAGSQNLLLHVLAVFLVKAILSVISRIFTKLSTDVSFFWLKEMFMVTTCALTLWASAWPAGRFFLLPANFLFYPSVLILLTVFTVCQITTGQPIHMYVHLLLLPKLLRGIGGCKHSIEN